MKSSVTFRTLLPAIYRSVSCVLFTRQQARLLLVCLLISVAALWLGVNRARMASFQSNIPAGSQPQGIALNPVTNKIYAANFQSNNVTVIDGVNHATITVPVGTGPAAVAINPVTNKIYVGNQSSDNVTVIDGADNSTATVAAGDKPLAIAINSVTNKIYVANQSSNNLTAIDGATNSTITVSVGTQPGAVAVNPITNKIYVVNQSSNNVTVINGADNSTATVAADLFPVAVAVNPVTDKIYVANQSGESITVINGADNSTVTVQNMNLAEAPSNVAVNPVTNKIYLSNYTGARVTILNGADNTTSFVSTSTSTDNVAVNSVSNTIYAASTNKDQIAVIDGVNNGVQIVSTATGAGTNPFILAVNPVTNKIYVVSSPNPGTAADVVSVINGADNSSASVTGGTQPYAVAVNPVTNKAYVANHLGNNVTVVNGADNSTATVPAGTGPLAIAVNPITNKTYVANHDSNDVTVINCADNSTVTAPGGTNPLAIAVNAITNKIYVANVTSNNVTIINGADNSTVTIPAGPGPTAVAVNQITNKAYVYNNAIGADDTVTVINGADNSTVTVHTGAHFAGNPFLTQPHAIAVNSVTNKIYVANSGVSTVTVINGADNSTATITTGSSPLAVAVNSITNKIYVSCDASSNVTVINGADNTTVTIPTHSLEYAIAVDEATNEIYVTNVGLNSVTVINGADNSKGDVPSERALDVAINPVTHKLYLANQLVNKASVVTEQNFAPDPLTTSITPQPSQPNATSRSFTFTAANSSSPIAPPVQQIHYQLDTWVNPWQTATPAGANPQPVTFGPLQDGIHILYAYATDGRDTGASPHIGQIESYLFFINSTAPSAPTAALVSISGHIATSEGSPLGGVAVYLNGGSSDRTITDAGGNYRFDNLTPSTFYSVSPSLVNYTFAPATRSFSLVGNKTDAVFTAVPDAAPAAAILTVTSTSDVNDGSCDSGHCSLREAIAAADPGDEIRFAVPLFATPQIITLTNGELVINKNLKITGPGAGLLTISGGNTSRVFFINPGAAGATSPPAPPFPVVSLSYLNLANGKAQGGNGGKGFQRGAGGGGGAGMGGAIFINGATLTIDHVTFDHNQALGGKGGDTADSANFAGGAGGGGTAGNGSDTGNGSGNVLIGGNGGGGGSFGGNGGPGGLEYAPGADGGEGSGGGGNGGNFSGNPSANNGFAACNGGFGGGGAGGAKRRILDGAFAGGEGGFGGGGGGGVSFVAPGDGGSFGGGGGAGGPQGGSGGGGAGLGGAVFVRAGNLTLLNCIFNSNSTTGGTGGTACCAPSGTNGQGKGGAIFIYTGATATAHSTNFNSNTAPDAAGTPTDNSDFYGPLQLPTAAPASISGQIATSEGKPLAGVALYLSGGHSDCTITDASGNYRFDNLTANALYAVAPSLVNYTFAPAARSFSLVGNQSDAVFTAVPDSAPSANPLDTDLFFVRQQYLDFLGREPDAEGLAYWANELARCGSDQPCIRQRRVAVSAAFFIAPEFQKSGSFIYQMYKASLGRQPSYIEFSADRVKVIGGADLEQQRQTFADEWVARASFRQAYPDSLSALEFVNRLFDTAGLEEYDVRRQQVAALINEQKTRANVLRAVIETSDFTRREYNPSFVLMQYFGYLRRDPDAGGYAFWLNVLNTRTPNNYSAMVCSFITSREYQERFSWVVTQANSDCTLSAG